METIFPTIRKRLSEELIPEFDEKKKVFETVIETIQKRSPSRANNPEEMMKFLSLYNQNAFEGMSGELIEGIKTAAAAPPKNSQGGGKRKKTYKRSSTKKSKSRRNRMRK